MTTRFPYLIAAITNQVWAMLPDRLQAVCEVVARRVEGYRLSREEIDAIKGHREPNGTLLVYEEGSGGQPLQALSRSGGAAAPQSKAIGVINVFGFIAQHASAVDDVSGPGGTSTERLGAAIDQAMADPQIGALVLNIDSPGGSVYGVKETFDKIMSYRGTKRIVAQANSMAASAAFWLASAADAIAVTPSGDIGSLGVYSVHRNISGAASAEGVEFTLISAGKYKVEGNQYQELGPEAKDYMQAMVDRHMADFVASVARGRGVSREVAATQFGEGRMVAAKDAVRLGMADEVATLDQTIQKLAKQMQPSRSGAKAYQDPDAVAAAVERAEREAVTIEAVQEAVEAQTASMRADIAELNATVHSIASYLRPVETAPQVAAPAADTSPLMKVCDSCGCNIDATGHPGPMDGNDGPGAAGEPPVQEHRQSSKMEPCTEQGCTNMREPPAAKNGAANDTAAPLSHVDDIKIERDRWRARRYAARRR